MSPAFTDRTVYFDTDGLGEAGRGLAQRLKQATQGNGTIVASLADGPSYAVLQRLRQLPDAHTSAPELCSPLWACACLEAGKLLPVGAHPLYQPLPAAQPPPGAQATKVCISGFTQLRRFLVLGLLEALGVDFSKQMNKARPPHFLVVADVNDHSEKIAAARELGGVGIVNLQWLLDSLLRGEVLPAHGYTSNAAVPIVFEGEVLQDSEQEEEQQGCGILADSASGGTEVPEQGAQVQGQQQGAGAEAAAASKAEQQGAVHEAEEVEQRGDGTPGGEQGEWAAVHAASVEGTVAESEGLGFLGGRTQAMAFVGGLAAALCVETQLPSGDLPAPRPMAPAQLPRSAPRPTAGRAPHHDAPASPAAPPEQQQVSAPDGKGRGAASSSATPSGLTLSRAAAGSVVLEDDNGEVQQQQQPEKGDIAAAAAAAVQDVNGSYLAPAAGAASGAAADAIAQTLPLAFYHLPETQVYAPGAEAVGGAEAALFGQSDVDACGVGMHAAPAEEAGAAAAEEADAAALEGDQEQELALAGGRDANGSTLGAGKGREAAGRPTRRAAGRGRPRKQAGPARAPFSQPLPLDSPPAEVEQHPQQRRRGGRAALVAVTIGSAAEGRRQRRQPAQQADAGAAPGEAPVEAETAQAGDAEEPVQAVADEDMPPADADDAGAPRRCSDSGTKRKAPAQKAPPQPRTTYKHVQQDEGEEEEEEEEEEAVPSKPVAAKKARKAAAAPATGQGKTKAAGAGVALEASEAHGMRVALSGFHTAEKQEMVSKLQALGVICHADGHDWQQGMTHIIAPELKRNQKCLAAMAAGAWLLGPRWADGAAGSLAPEVQHELRAGQAVEHGAASHWRCKAAASGAGAFAGLRFAVSRGLDSPPSREDISAIVRAGGGEVVALSAPADVLLVSAATAAGSTAAQRQVKAGGAVATAQFVVEWLAHPSASLDQHLLLRSRRSANLAAAEHARSHGGAASAGRPSESDERSLSM